MKIVKIAFDVDQTLISNTNGIGFEHLNLEVFEVMRALSTMRNTEIIVWSGGGGDYAESVVRKFGLSPYISRCYSKQEYDESIDGVVDIAFDDEGGFSLASINIIVK